MKKSLKLLSRRVLIIYLMLIAVSVFSMKSADAQDKPSITGKLIDGRTNLAVPYATIALIKESGNVITGGAMSDDNGVFIISSVLQGNYNLMVSNIGYKPLTKSIEVRASGVTDAGILILQDTSIMLNELIIVGDRLKAKSESGRTIFNMTKKIADASNTGVDVLRLIPGIQIDLMQNISLEGSQNILIYVDGKERDRSFVGQLSPKQIDRVEIISSPPSNYDGNITGAINIILKKERDSGINGQVLAEIPSSSSEVYIFPTFSLNWNIKKLTMFTSWKGEMTYLNLHEKIYRMGWTDVETNEFTVNEYLRQKNWSQRFNYGIGYFFSEHDQINFYAFYNPFSRELDGNVDSEMSGTINNIRKVRKEDTDVNAGSFCSLYYKHGFNGKGGELTTDISNYFLRADNRTDFIYNDPGNDIITINNILKPEQNVMSIKTDYSRLLGKNLNFSTGLKGKFQSLQDSYNNFAYNENIFAAYGAASLKQSRYDISFGLRAERSATNIENSFNKHFLSFLPYGNFRYKLTPKQNIQLSYNKSVTRPDIYQLNPSETISDLYSVYKGNPFLKPELRTSIFIEHSIQLNSNYFASRVFFGRRANAINNLMFLNDNGLFETQVQNLGRISQYGLQFSGALKFSIFTFNPYLKFYSLHTSGNILAKENLISNRNSLSVESGLSAIASFKHEFTFSLTFQYSSPENDIQGNSFSDLLYFLSLEKNFGTRVKIGIVSAVPIMKSFTYRGSEINGFNFHSHYEGNVNMSLIPFWFKLSYQFSQGKTRGSTNRSGEEIESLPKKGF